MNSKKQNNFLFIGIKKLLKKSTIYRQIQRKKSLRKTRALVDILHSSGIIVEKERNRISFRYTINNNSFLFQLKKNSSDSSVFQQIIMQKEYEVIIDFFQKNKKPLVNMVDAGANIGLTSIFFKAYFPNSFILALEPSKDTFDRLIINIESNMLNDVICLNKGLWSHRTFLSPDSNFRDGRDWAFRLTDAPEHKCRSFEAVSIPDLIKEYHLECIDFLKIDIEGGEASVFSEKADLSWLTKVKVLAMEIHDEFNCRTSIENILLKFDYSISVSGEITIGINNKFLPSL